MSTKAGQLHIDPATTAFRLYVTPVHSGKLCGALSAAQTDAAADWCIDYIEAQLSALPKKPYCYRYLRRLLELDVKPRRSLIRNFQVESVHADPIEAIRDLIKTPISPQIVERCCEYAIGKAKEQADGLIRTGQTPSILAGPFQRAFRAFVKANDLSGLLHSLAPKPTGAEIKDLLAGSPRFVRQLELIELPYDHRVRAVSDFLQSSSDKTQWAENGDILRDSLDGFDASLLRAHSFIDLELKDAIPPLDPPVHGRQLYARCCQTTHKLEEREPPAHFVPGCFNDLANRNELGWHPDHATLLAPGDE